MILKNIKREIRRVINQPLFSGIKYLGLTIGMACVIIISVWVQNELSFDKFHENPENICRVIMDMGEHGNLALTPSPLIDKIQNDFPEIETASRVEDCPKIIVKYEDIVFYEQGGIFADPEFFDVFSFKLLSGNKSSLLNDPFNVVISESFSQKYFGNSNAVNKSFLAHGFPFQVTGVFENIPENSHLQFDFILPIQLKKQMGYELNNWGDVNLHTYVRVKNKTNLSDLNSKITSWETPRDETFFLQPLTKIHGTTKYMADNAKISDKLYVYVFSSIAVLILLIACINYITLFLSSAYKRTKEIGIMKIIGADRKRLIGEFMVETSGFILVSLVSALLLVSLVTPVFNQIIGTQLSFNFNNVGILASLFVLALVLLMVIGIYPALHLSSLHPQTIFQKEKGSSNLISKFKNVMVLLQFTITTVLIIGLLMVSKQLNFIQNKDLGFQKENVVYLPFEGIGDQYDSFKEKVINNSSVLSATIKNTLPMEVADKTSGVGWPGKDPEADVIVEATAVGFDYFETMGLSITSGRDFSALIASDKTGVVLNQEAAKMMNLTEPIGKTIRLWDYSVNIIGITNNALFYSLKENVGPQIYYMVQDYSDDSMTEGVILLSISDYDIEGTMTSIKAVWNEFAPDIPFTYHFLDQEIDNLYWAEKKMFAIMKYFVIISILISCLGLFGSATYSTQHRTKEIGIRKVNGAKISEILNMLNKDFIKWVVIAFIVACPIAYYAMNKWLENFAYKTTLSWWIFALAGVLALGIALLTVSWQSWRAASRNPVEALRYE